MSLSPNEMYPGATEPDPEYLDGKYKDSSSPSVFDGTPLDKLLHNQNLSFQDAIMKDAQEAYNGTADTPDTSQLFKAAKKVFGSSVNLLQNHNFIINGDPSQPTPDATARPYAPGFEIKSGWFADDTTGVTVTYIDNQLKVITGTYYQKVPKTGALVPLTEFSAWAKPVSGPITDTGITWQLVGDEYVITVSAAAGDVFAVKFKEGSQADAIETISLFDIYGYPNETGKSDVRAFGALAFIDSTQMIQDAVIEAEKTGAELVGQRDIVYLVSDTIEISRSIEIRDLNLKPFSDLPALTPVLRISSGETHKVTMYNVNIDGDRYNQTSPGGAGDGGKHGLDVAGDCAIVSENLTCNNCITDGVYYNPSQRAKSINKKVFKNTTCDNNGRQGVSGISFDNLHFDGLVTTNTNGLPPQAGVDLEPNGIIDFAGTISIKDHISTGNFGRGFVVAMAVNAEFESIAIDGQELANNGLGGLETEALRIAMLGSGGNARIKSLSIKNQIIDGRFSVDPDVLVDKFDIDGQVQTDVINMEFAGDIVTVNDIRSEAPDGAYFWMTIRKVKNLTISNSDLRPGAHVSVEGSIGTSMLLEDVDNLVVKDCTAAYTGFRLFQIRRTSGRCRMLVDNLVVGDGPADRNFEVNFCDFTIVNSVLPKGSENDLYLRDSSVGTVIGNTFATGAIISVVEASVLAALSGNVNLPNELTGTSASVGASSITVTHNMGSVPASIQLLADNTEAGNSDYYVDSIASNSFVIRNIVPLASFTWNVKRTVT